VQPRVEAPATRRAARAAEAAKGGPGDDAAAGPADEHARWRRNLLLRILHDHVDLRLLLLLPAGRRGLRPSTRTAMR
jgi:hypothetical protein